MRLFLKNLLNKRSTEAVLTQELRSEKNSDDPGLIYVSPKLVTDIKDYNYGLLWYMSYNNCQI